MGSGRCHGAGCRRQGRSDGAQGPDVGLGRERHHESARGPRGLRQLHALSRLSLSGQGRRLGDLERGKRQRFWPSGQNPVQYTQLLESAYGAVKAIDPSSLVVYGGLAYSDYAFVERSYAAGAKGFFDVMAVHPYMRTSLTGSLPT